MKYDSNSEASPFSFSLVAKNKEFGAYQFMMIEKQKYRTSIVERENQFSMGSICKNEYQTVIKYNQGNPNFKNKYQNKEFFDVDLQVSF